MDPIYIMGALVAAIYGLVEALKMRTQRKNGNFVSFNAEDRRILTSLASSGAFEPKDRRQLETLFEQHQKVDLEGVPLWYVPRRIIDGQEKTTERVGELLTAQVAILAELKSMNSKIGRLNCPYESTAKEAKR